MENNNKDLIRFIDAILHEIEVASHPDKITLSNLSLPFPSDYQNLIRQNKFLLKLKGKAAADSKILGYRKLPLFYIIQKPNKEKLLKIKKELSKSDSEQKATTRKKSGRSMAIYLDNTGDLWREPKKKYCYEMGEKSDRHKIVRHLAGHNGYQPTALISSILEGKSEQSIRTEIGKIRNNITRLLKVPGKKVIEGRKESGYRNNPAYKILIKTM